MHAPPAPPARGRGRSQLGCLLIAVCFVGTLLVAVGLTSRQEVARVAADPLIGQVRTVKPDCSITIYRDNADYDAEIAAWNDPQAIKDGAPAAIIRRAVAAGRAWVPSPGTRVRISDRRRGETTVEILNGIHAGHVGRPFSDRCLVA